ncbi:MAG: tetratricopeptide repeat protein [Gammaproteobacteria bacterium]
MSCPHYYRSARKLLFQTAFTGTLLFASLAALADVALDAYERGNKAFNAGHYQDALSAYLEAQAGGLRQNTLIYNIGVTHYKLQHYKKARRAFQDLLDDAQMAPLAYYNLGLVALKLDDKQEARRWFRRTIAESDSPKLRAAADAMVARLDGRKQSGKPSPWSGFVTIGGGYDSNVTLRSDSETLVASDQNDYFLELFAYGSGRVAGDRNRGANLEGSFYLLNYKDLNTYDTTSLRLGGSLDRRLDQWRLNSGLHYTRTLLDKNGYTHSAAFSLRGKRRLMRNQQLRLRYELSYIDDLDKRFSFLEGWRQKANASSLWNLDNKRLILAYQLELNDRKDLNTPRFISYSPTRHTLRLRGRIKFTPRYDASLDLRYRYSRYNDPSELADGSDKTRKENRYRATFDFSRYLKKGRTLTAEYRYTSNASNFRRYDYHRHEVMLNVLWPW